MEKPKNTLHLKPTLLLYFLILACFSSYAQDPTFSQTRSGSLLLNPSFAGTTGAARAGIAYRNQWPAIASGGYTDFNMAYDQYIKLLHAGAGINFLNDIQGGGTIQTQRVDFVYAQHFQLFSHKLSVIPSLDVAYIQSTLDLTKLNFGDSIDPRRGFVYTSTPAEPYRTVQKADISAGLLMYTKSFSAGFSAFHLNRPDLGFFGSSPLPTRYTMHLAYTLHLGTAAGVTLSPSLVYKMQGDFREFVPAVSGGYKNVYVGLGYRNQDACIFMAGFRNNGFGFAYSYDYTVSRLTNAATGGSHELSLQVYLFTKHKPENFLVYPLYSF